MKNIFLTSLICLILFPCCTKKEDLTLEVLNDKIISRSDINEKDIEDGIYFNNYLYDSVPVNKIDIKITNNGTKKYVFFMGKDLDQPEINRPENLHF